MSCDFDFKIVKQQIHEILFLKAYDQIRKEEDAASPNIRTKVFSTNSQIRSWNTWSLVKTQKNMFLRYNIMLLDSTLISKLESDTHSLTALLMMMRMCHQKRQSYVLIC